MRCKSGKLAWKDATQANEENILSIIINSTAHVLQVWNHAKTRQIPEDKTHNLIDQAGERVSLLLNIRVSDIGRAGMRVRVFPFWKQISLVFFFKKKKQTFKQKLV